MERTPVPIVSQLFPIFRLADQLRHGAHGTVDAPAAGLEQHHRGQSKDGRGQHDTVEAEGELRHAGMEQRPVVGPVPRQFEGPQQGDRLFEILRPSKYQIGVPQHQEEHRKEKDQETISERFALHPARDILLPGQPEASAQYPE